MSIFHEGRHRTDLDSVRVVGRVFKQPVVGIEEFSRQQEEELSRRTAVVKSGWKRSLSIYCRLLDEKYSLGDTVSNERKTAAFEIRISNLFFCSSGIHSKSKTSL